MPKSKRPAPSRLNFPKPEDIIPKDKLPEGSVSYTRKVLTIERITNCDPEALIINVLLAGILFLVMYLYIMAKTHIKPLAVLLPSILIWAIVVFNYKRLYTTVAARKGKLYLDPIERKLNFYFKGFHFTRIYAQPEPDEVTFMKDELMIADKSAKEPAEKELVFTTQGGIIDMLCELNVVFRLIEDADGLEHSLTYSVPEIKRRLRSYLSEQFAALGALNSWESVLHYRSELLQWAQSLFAGSKKRSPIEQELGIDVQACNATLDFTEESKKFLRMRTLGKTFIDLVEDFKEEYSEITDEEARVLASAATGIIPKSVRVIEVRGKDLPAGLTSLYAGDVPAAVGGRE